VVDAVLDVLEEVLDLLLCVLSIAIATIATITANATNDTTITATTFRDACFRGAARIGISLPSSGLGGSGSVIDIS
jgi:hypothetical protein